MLFRKSAQVTLDATGAGQCQINADGSALHVTGLSVNTTPAVSKPRVDIYLNQVSEKAWLEGTYSGDRDSSDTVHDLSAGESLIAVWSGGDPGARGTILARGEQA